MKITLEAIRGGNVPKDDLRTFLRNYDGIDPETLGAEECHAVQTALDMLLQPMPSTPADALVEAIGDRLGIVPVLTCTGARIASVDQITIEIGLDADGNRMFNDIMLFAYDDGVKQTLFCELGDHGLSLVLDGSGAPAFFTSLTSDGMFDAMHAAGKAGLGIDFLTSIHTVARDRLHLFAGDVDAAAIAAEPRPRCRSSFDRHEAPPAPKPMSIRQLYEAPPTPKGRAQLGRRR